MFPSFNIQTKSTINTSNNIHSNVMLCGFTNSGPTDKICIINSIDKFKQIYGLPNTDLEYASYVAVTNAIYGGALVYFRRLPYEYNDSDIDLDTSCYKYISNKSLNDVIELYANKLENNDDDIITDALNNIFEPTDNSKSHYWALTDNISDADTYIKLKFNTPRQTIIVNNESIKPNPTGVIGIGALMLGSFELNAIKSNDINLVNYLINNVKFNVNFSKLFNNDSLNSAFDRFNFKISGTQAYHKILNRVNLFYKDQLTTVVFQYYLSGEYEVTFNILECVTGTLRDDDSNLIDLVNDKSNFITAELHTSNNDNLTDIYYQYVDNLNDGHIYMTGRPYDTNDYRVINYENVIKAIDDIEADISFKQTLTNSIYNYIAMPGVSDIMFKSDDNHVKNNIYTASIDGVEADFDKLNAFILRLQQLCLTQFKDTIAFVDMPYVIAKKIANISTNMVVAKQQVMAIKLLEKITPIVDQSPNVMLYLNHQHIDLIKSDAVNNKQIDKTIIVPPSALLLYSYCFNDYYDDFDPIAGSDLKYKFAQAHGGVIDNKRYQIAKVLCNTYNINSFASNNSNQIFPIQQYLNCKPNLYKHANNVRLVRRIKSQLRLLAAQFLYEPNTDKLRASCQSTIENYLQTFKQIEKYKVICDSTNNTYDTIDANELHITVMISIASIVLTINITLDNLGVDVS